MLGAALATTALDREVAVVRELCERYECGWVTNLFPLRAKPHPFTPHFHTCKQNYRLESEVKNSPIGEGILNTLIKIDINLYY